MYVPYSGDMNYILAGNEAICKAYAKAISRLVKMFKGIKIPVRGKRFSKISLGNA